MFRVTNAISQKCMSKIIKKTTNSLSESFISIKNIVWKVWRKQAPDLIITRNESGAKLCYALQNYFGRLKGIDFEHRAFRSNF